MQNILPQMMHSAVRKSESIIKRKQNIQGLKGKRHKIFPLLSPLLTQGQMMCIQEDRKEMDQEKLP